MFIKRYGNPIENSDGSTFKTDDISMSVVFENSKAVEISYRSEGITDLSASLGSMMKSLADNPALAQKILKTQWDGEWVEQPLEKFGRSIQAYSWVTPENSLKAQWTIDSANTSIFLFKVWNCAWATAKENAQNKADSEKASDNLKNKLDGL